MLADNAGANDHEGLAGPMSRNRQSCENFEISFEYFLGKETRFSLRIFKFEKLKRFFTDDAWKAVSKLG